MSEIHYFPRYSQPENVVTNNTLLLLLRIYQYNRYKFERLLEVLCSDDAIELASPGLQFRQQKSTGKSVVDGFIFQDSMKIAVETKLHNAFDFEQLENHLALFGTEQYKLLILLSPSIESNTDKLNNLRAKAGPGIQILSTSFDDIICGAASCLSDHDEEMQALVQDYESFCSDMGLLLRDKCTLFVPPCSQSFKENIENALYYCPATWSRRKAKYLGIYANKAVQAIGTIANRVVCKIDLDGDKLTISESTRSLRGDEEKRILKATRKALERGWDLRNGHRFYLCDEMVKTDFQKVSSGGIMGHRYFDLEKVFSAALPPNIGELALRLRQHTWQ